MPWKETRVDEERMKMVALALEQDFPFVDICRSFGVSRKTGYKWLERFLDQGLDGLKDESRAPLTHSNATEDEIVDLLVATRGAHRTWGPRKLLRFLSKKKPGKQWPAVSTAGDILRRAGLVKPRPKRRPSVVTVQAPFAAAAVPNDVWGVDFKGNFKMGDGKRCEPLTVTDGCSRKALMTQGFKDRSYRSVRPQFERLFEGEGLPCRFRSDNGTPFASIGLCGLTELSVWWIKLGIVLERIDPGQPQQNGRHERYHRTLKAETARPPAKNLHSQQAAFDKFMAEYNGERPHEALDYKTPGEVHTRSTRSVPSCLLEPQYPGYFEVCLVRANGTMRWEGADIYLSPSLSGEQVGVEPMDDRFVRLYFFDVELGVLDSVTDALLANRRLRYRAATPAPMGAGVANSNKVSPMCPV